MKEVLADILLTHSCYFTRYAIPTHKFEQAMSIVFGFSKEFIGSVMRALKYKMFYITLIFIAEKIWAMLFILCTSCIRLVNFVWLVVKVWLLPLWSCVPAIPVTRVSNVWEVEETRLTSTPLMLIPPLYNCGNRYGDSWYLDVRKAHDNKSTSFRANITGIWSRPTNGEKKPSWRAAGQKKRAGFSPLDWIRRIPEWRRLEEEGNLRVRAFSQGWWLERDGEGRGEEEDNFLFLASFCPTCEETTRTGDRSGIAHPIK